MCMYRKCIDIHVHVYYTDTYIIYIHTHLCVYIYIHTYKYPCNSQQDFVCVYLRQVTHPRLPEASDVHVQAGMSQGYIAHSLRYVYVYVYIYI